MTRFHFEYWYRHGNFDKDFDFVSIAAKTEEEARVAVKKERPLIFKIILKSKEPCQDV